jgi:hypothetical protein
MQSVYRYLPRPAFVGIVLALQPVLVSLLTLAASGEEFSSRRWFAQAAEPLPVPRMQAESTDSLPEQCKPAPVDLPLSELTTDVRPRDRERQVVSADALPVDCADHIFTEERFLSIGLSSDSCRANRCDVLRLAHFCHRPLYFEEECLERCGMKSCCCQPAASALHFYSHALLLPMKMCCVCPCSCVPAKYCH